MKPFYLHVRSPDAVQEHFRDMVRGLKQINPIKVFLRNCGEDCARTEHVFPKEVALQRIEEEVLLIPVGANRREALPITILSLVMLILPTGARTLNRMSPASARRFFIVQYVLCDGNLLPKFVTPWWNGRPLPSSL